MELHSSFFCTAPARINGELSGSSTWPSLRTRHKDLQLSSHAFSTIRMAHSCSAMREPGILFCPIGRSFTSAAQLASDFRQKGGLRGVLWGWIDNDRTTIAGPALGVPGSRDNAQAYARLRRRAALKETNNDPWESQSEVTELGNRVASFDMRGRETSLDDSELNVEFETADEGVAKADDTAGSRRGKQNDSFDDRNFTMGRNIPETHSRKGEGGAGTERRIPLSFRTGGNASAGVARNTLMDDTTDRSRLDLRYGRGLFKEEDVYEDGEREEQIDPTQILMDAERPNGKYVPGGRQEILQWREREAALELSRKKFVEGNERELLESDKQKALKSTAGIADKRRLLKRSKMIAKQIISQSSAMALGFVSQMWVNTVLWQVTVLEVKPSLLSGEVEGVLLNDVCQVGDVILVSDESALESELTVLESEVLVGYDIVTEAGYSLGKVRDYSFALLDGKVTSLEFDSLGFSLVPSNLISIYRLDVNEVLAVSSDSLLVKHGAESRARRLTKGILQFPQVQGRPRSQRLAGSQRRKSRHQEMSHRGEQMHLQTKQLPSRGSVGFFGDIELDGLEHKTGHADRWSPMGYGSSQRKP